MLKENEIETAIRILREPRTRMDIVYLLLLLIPIGKVVSYSTLAHILKTTPRVIARYLAMNKYAPLIPCHRVVTKRGELGGYTPGGREMKRRLLRLEGVEVQQDRVPTHVYFDCQLKQLLT
ncbi:MAG TPA: MGMT family protein [Ignisphaera aggregans]|uniref:MGMT family protein n=1 Tax=Ignisphaera aggregans TaxID=334771 RepID=A0A832YTQ3_9CREN|nr:MGMT family protein [Ignisphaera aggregans]